MAEDIERGSLEKHLGEVIEKHAKTHSGELFLTLREIWRYKTRFYKTRHELDAAIKRKGLDANGVIYLCGYIPEKYNKKIPLSEILFK